MEQHPAEDPTSDQNVYKQINDANVDVRTCNRNWLVALG